MRTLSNMLMVFYNRWRSGGYFTCLSTLLISFCVFPAVYGLSITTQPLHEGLEEESITLMCKYTAPSDGGSQYVITWDWTPEWGSTTETVLVKQGTGSETSYGQFSGRASISGSQGDMVITGLQVDDTGTFTCDVDYYVVKDEGSATTQLEVYKPVSGVDIMGYYTGEYVSVVPGDVTTMTCNAYGGRPQALLVWYLDNVVVGAGINITYNDNGDGTYDTWSDLEYTFSVEDHDKTLKCQSDQSPEIEDMYESDYVTIDIQSGDPDPPANCECDTSVTTTTTTTTTTKDSTTTTTTKDYTTTTTTKDSTTTTVTTVEHVGNCVDDCTQCGVIHII